MKHEINDFIGEFYNVLDSEYCQTWIDYFDVASQLNLSYTREQCEGNNYQDRHKKDDTTVFLLDYSSLQLTTTAIQLRPIMDNFWNCYELYVKKYSIISETHFHKINSARLQKTQPGQGYHIWHYETMDFETSSRMLGWMYYLNDIEDGGETEFLYYPRRIKPEAGKLLIWPAGFPHTHRGNPPLKNNKYVITGWVEISPTR